jgi:ankyrin
LLDAGASVDALHYGEGTALHEAAQRGFEKVTEVLIQEGAKTGAYQPGRRTALHVAARQGNVKIVNMLLDAGVDANIDMPGDGIALYVAAAAGHDKLVDVLSTVSDVDVGRYGYWKALTFASMHGNAKMVDLLHRLATDSNNPCYNIKYRQVESENTIYIEYRGAKDAIDTFKATYRTALKRASERGNAKMVVFLLDTAEATPTDSLGTNPALRAAAAGRHLDVIEEFIRISRVSVNVWGKKYGCALHRATWGGHKNVAARLLQVGADPFAQNEDHGTPLHMAAMRGHKDVVELLVQNNHDTVNVVWPHHGTPLHVAARQGHLSIVEILLERGADLSVTGDHFGTPLHEARAAGHLEMVQRLVDAE